MLSDVKLQIGQMVVLNQVLWDGKVGQATYLCSLPGLAFADVGCGIGHIIDLCIWLFFIIISLISLQLSV